MTSSTAAWKIESSQNHRSTYSESALKIHIKIMEEGLFVVHQLRKLDCVVAPRKHQICSISIKFKKQMCISFKLSQFSAVLSKMLCEKSVAVILF